MDPAVFDRMTKAWGKKRFSDLATDLEVRPNTLHSWRSRGKIPFEYLERTARQRGVSLDWLVLGQESAPSAAEQCSPAYLAGTPATPADQGASLHGEAAGLVYAWLSERKLNMAADKFAAAVDALVDVAEGSSERLRRQAARVLPLIVTG